VRVINFLYCILLSVTTWLQFSAVNILAILWQDDDSSSRTSDDWNYRRPRSSYGGNGRGRWNDSIPNNIVLMRGLPAEAVETDVSVAELFFSLKLMYTVAEGCLGYRGGSPTAVQS